MSLRSRGVAATLRLCLVEAYPGNLQQRAKGGGQAQTLLRTQALPKPCAKRVPGMPRFEVASAQPDLEST